MQGLTVANTQTMHASLAAHITSSNPAMLPDALSPMGAAALNAEITRQATMVAYVDDFWLMGVVSLLCFAMVLLLLRQPKARLG